MKRFIILLLALMALFLIACDKEEGTDTDTDTSLDTGLPSNSPELYEYKEVGQCYEVVGIKESRSEVIIPESYNGKKVIGIGERAFFGDEQVQKIVLPEGIKYINAKAFKDCKNLEEINFPETLSELGEDAIFNCEKLKYESYRGCSYIGRWLMKLDDTSIDTLEIRDGTFGIAPFACYFSQKLRIVNIPASVKYIGSHAFFSCSFLRNITIGENVEYIGRYAFAQCPLFKNVNIPVSVQAVEASAFYGCRGTLTYMGGKTLPAGFDLSWNGSCEIIYGENNG